MFPQRLLFRCWVFQKIICIQRQEGQRGTKQENALFPTWPPSPLCSCTPSLAPKTLWVILLRKLHSRTALLSCLPLPPSGSLCVVLLAGWQENSSNGLQLPSSQMAHVSKGRRQALALHPPRRTISSSHHYPTGWIKNFSSPPEDTD